jgi:Flp pilus assembly protein TadG
MSHFIRRSSAGQSLVELALVLPILIVLFLGTAEIGRIYFAQIALEEAVQEGATYAAQQPTDGAGIANRVTTSSDHPEVVGAAVGSPICTAETVTVSATYQLPTVTPVGGMLFGGTFQLGSTVAATNLAGGCS